MQPHQNTESHRFQYARDDLKSRIAKYVQRTTWKLGKFKAAADEIISKNNRAFHPVTLQELDVLVQRAIEAILSSPQIRAELSNECIILDDYDGIKRDFP